MIVIASLAPNIAPAQKRRSRSRVKPSDARSVKTPSSVVLECTLTLAQSPELRGIRLGMTPDQIAKGFPSFDERYSVFKPDADGVIPAFDFTDNSGEVFLATGFLDGRVHYFYVTYRNPPGGLTLDEFASKIAESLQLSPSWYKTDGLTGKEIECDGFSVEVRMSSILGPTVTVWVLRAQKVIEQRKYLREKRSRDAFKP